MIKDSINQQIADALKAHDELRLTTLRMLSSAFNYEKIAKQHDLTEEEEINVVRKEAKKRTDAIEGLRASAGKGSFATPEVVAERLAKEEKELEILKQYLPSQMEDSELAKIVEDTVRELEASEMKDMGRVIAAIKTKAEGRADGARIAQLVKSKLS